MLSIRRLLYRARALYFLIKFIIHYLLLILLEIHLPFIFSRIIFPFLAIGTSLFGIFSIYKFIHQRLLGSEFSTPQLDYVFELTIDKISSILDFSMRALPTLLHKFKLALHLTTINLLLLVPTIFLLKICPALVPYISYNYQIIVQESLVNRLFGSNSTGLMNSLSNTIFYTPIIEEVLTRYVALEAIKRILNKIKYTILYVINIFSRTSNNEDQTRSQQMSSQHEVSYSAIVGQSLIFSGLHLSPKQKIHTFLTGLTFGYYYEKNEGDLIAPIFSHMMHNMLSVIPRVTKPILPLP